jgi:Sulfotransferase domain
MSGLKVIGVGYARTGTFSLKIALDRLGFRCYHMFELFNRLEDAKLWLRAYNEEEREEVLKAIFSDYEATVDFPSITFYRDLIKQYPDAKVIRTIRDSNSWYDSFQSTINEAHQSVPYLIGCRMKNYALFKVIDRCLIRPFAENFSNRPFIISYFEKYNAEVIESIPAERLLIYRVEQGWKPLCEFLNVPIPDDIPFPHANDRQHLIALLNQTKKMGWWCIIIGITVVLFVAGLFYYWSWY